MKLIADHPSPEYIIGERLTVMYISLDHICNNTLQEETYTTNYSRILSTAQAIWEEERYDTAGHKITSHIKDLVHSGLGRIGPSRINLCMRISSLLVIGSVPDKSPNQSTVLTHKRRKRGKRPSPPSPSLYTLSQ